MSNKDDLHDVFGPLRSNATTAELADEAVTVDAMAHAHIASKGRITMLNSRKARVATLIAAGIIGFGGVAAAGTGGLSQTLELPEEDPVGTTIATTVPEETDEPEPSTPTTEAPKAAIVLTNEGPLVPEGEFEEDADPVVEADDDVPVDDLDTVFDEETCLKGNHGKTVSAVARGEFPVPEDGVEVEVRDAAHSSCGKTERDDTIEADDAESDDEKHESDDDSGDDDDDDDGDDDDGDGDDDDGDGDSDHDGDDGDDGDDDDESSEKAEKPAKKNGNSASKDKGGNGRGKNPKGD